MWRICSCERTVRDPAAIKRDGVRPTPLSPSSCSSTPVLRASSEPTDRFCSESVVRTSGLRPDSSPLASWYLSISIPCDRRTCRRQRTVTMRHLSRGSIAFLLVIIGIDVPVACTAGPFAGGLRRGSFMQANMEGATAPAVACPTDRTRQGGMTGPGGIAAPVGPLVRPCSPVARNGSFSGAGLPGGYTCFYNQGKDALRR